MKSGQGASALMRGRWSWEATNLAVQDLLFFNSCFCSLPFVLKVLSFRCLEFGWLMLMLATLLAGLFSRRAAVPPKPHCHSLQMPAALSS